MIERRRRWIREREKGIRGGGQGETGRRHGDSIGITTKATKATQQHSSTATQQHSNTATKPHSNKACSKVAACYQRPACCQRPRLHYRLLTLCPEAYRPCAPGRRGAQGLCRHRVSAEVSVSPACRGVGVGCLQRCRCRLPAPSPTLSSHAPCDRHAACYQRGACNARIHAASSTAHARFIRDERGIRDTCLPHPLHTPLA